MPQGDDEASTVKEALVHAQDAVIAYLDTAEVLQPSIGALDFPAPPIAAELAFVFKAALFSAAQVGSDQLRALIPQPLAQLIRIVTAIRNHTAQPLARAATSSTRYSYPRQRAFREPELGDLRGRKLRSDRYTLAVDHHHALRTFPATGFSDGAAPFFASTKVASRKASSQSSNFRSSNRASNPCQARSHTPCSSHRRRRRQQVEPWGYSLGRSRHRAPTRRTQRIPSKQLRLDAQGRPRPSFRRGGAGNKSSICFHCWSLSIMTTANLNQQHLLKYQL